VAQDQLKYILKVSAASPADAGRYALELRSMLLRSVPDIRVELRRDNPYTQDLGHTLVLLLGTPAVVIAVTKLIETWLKLYYSASITIEKEDGKVTKVIAANVTNRAVSKIKDAFLEEKGEKEDK